MLRTTLFFFSLLCSPLAAESFQAVALQYEPGVRVLQTHQFEWALDLELPRGALSNRATQSIDCQLRLLSEEDDPIEEGPFTLELILTRIKIDLSSNGVEQKFDSDEEDNSPQMALLRHILDRPIKLEIDRDYALPQQIADLQQTYQRLPQLEQLLPEAMLNDMFQSIVCMAGQTLSAGTKREQELSVGAAQPLRVPVTYEVVRANYKDVEAQVSGKLAEQSQDMAQSLGASQWFSAALGELKLSSSVRGKVSWRRRNALVCQQKIEEDYEGSLSISGKADQSVPVKGRWVHRIQSKRL